MTRSFTSRSAESACPESPDGLPYVTDGSCNNCGDKNREDN